MTQGYDLRRGGQFHSHHDDIAGAACAAQRENASEYPWRPLDWRYCTGNIAEYLWDVSGVWRIDAAGEP